MRIFNYVYNIIIAADKTVKLAQVMPQGNEVVR